MENPTKMDDLGVPLFSDTSIYPKQSRIFSLLTTAVFFSSPCLPGRGSASSAPDTMVVGAPGGKKMVAHGGMRIYTPPPPEKQHVFSGNQRLVQMYFPIEIVDILILWGVRVPPSTATPPRNKAEWKGNIKESWWLMVPLLRLSISGVLGGHWGGEPP